MPAVSPLRHPLILVHGLFGFDRLKVIGWEAMSYFRGIGESLKSKGLRVAAPQLSPTAGITERAQQLTDFIRSTFPQSKVHLIAHSMGGLDSRYALSCLGLHDQVLSLTTLGTPHQGSPVADLGVSRLEGYLKPWLRYLRIPHDAFYDLMTERCQAFNQKVVDVESVDYYAVAGRNHGPWLSPEWWIPAGIVAFREGANDGIVSIKSAHHHYQNETWDGDHLSLVNGPNPKAIAWGAWRARQYQYFKLIERLARLEASL
jgi:triacylglycerol lipase